MAHAVHQDLQLHSAALGTTQLRKHVPEGQCWTVLLPAGLINLVLIIVSRLKHVHLLDLKMLVKNPLKLSCLVEGLSLLARVDLEAAATA